VYIYIWIYIYMACSIIHYNAMKWWSHIPNIPSISPRNLRPKSSILRNPSSMRCSSRRNLDRHGRDDLSRSEQEVFFIW
jgi:hypothetical protein